MVVISSSYGNDSCAVIQWVYESRLDWLGKVFVVFIDTGWSAKNWPEQLKRLFRLGISW